MCQLLIKSGARVNGRSRRQGEAGETALMVAVAEGHAEVVRLLFEHSARRRGGQPTAVGSCPGPLHLAAQRGSLELVQLLCQYGAAVDKKDRRAEYGKTALMYAGGQP